MLRHLLAMSGVQSACITDDAGRVVASEGGAAMPASVLVLALATLTAAGELGRRGGAGECIEVVQHHEAGLYLLRGMPRGHALIVACAPQVDLAALRHAAALVHLPLASAPAPRRPVPQALDLGDALHAMPAW
jgi:hypothetical protein